MSLGTDWKRSSAGTRRESRIKVAREGRRGAVALRLVLMSRVLSLPDHAPPASYRLGSCVRVVRYGRAHRAVQEIVAKSRRYLDDIAQHSLRIGGAAAPAVGRDIWERVIKGEGSWMSTRIRRTRGIALRLPERFEVSQEWQAVCWRDSRGKEPYGVGNDN